MKPFDLDATGLMIWGLVAHLFADWLLQNDWMAANKARRRAPRPRHGDGMITPPRIYQPPDRWWDRHPAAYVHAGIHGVLLALVFGWAALPLALVHLAIDTRTPIVWWSQLIRQTQPSGEGYDVGLEVRFWTDQVAHIATIAVAALVVGGVA